MALIVHVPLTFNGRRLARGAAVFGAEADAIARHPVHSRKCSAVDDAQFAHLRPEAAKNQRSRY